MKKNVYKFHFENIEDDWERVLVYDVETVPDLQTLKEVIASGNREYLDAKKAQHVCMAMRTHVYNSLRTAQANKVLKRYEKHERDGWTYFTRMNTNAEEIAKDVATVARAYDLDFVAHNGKRFDFLVLELVKDGRVYQAKGNAFFVYRRKYHRLIDTLELTGGNLENSCKAMGVDIVKAYDEDLKAYLENDVYMLTRLVDALRSAGIKYTMTRTARKFFYDVVSPEGIKRVKTITDEGFAPEYAGGRTEVFKAWAGDLKVYDVNSLYPFVMARFLYPATVKEGEDIVIRVWKARKPESFIAYIESIREAVKETLLTDARRLKDIVEMKSVYYHAKVRLKGIHASFKDLEDVILRYFPFSLKYKGRRVFSLNTSEVYHVEGYEVAFLAMFEFELIDLYVSEAEKLWFAPEIERLYEERKRAKKEGDILRTAQKKAILVNLYGVFGLRQEKVTTKRIKRTEKEKLLPLFNGYSDVEVIEEARLLKAYGNEKTLNVAVLTKEYVVEEKTKDFARVMSAPTIATGTTSHGRFWLLANIYHIVLNRGGEVYYVDTDSVFTNITLESSEELGAFKNEGTYRKAFFFAPKTYILEDEKGDVEIAAKGTGDALVKEFITQTFKTNFRLLRRMAISLDRKTLKIPQGDGWMRTLQDEVDYFTHWRDVLEKAMVEIENEGVRNDLRAILDEATKKG
ncbi:MAG: DNA polymerase, partial [Candidatus Kapaibacteriota bacterium]